MSAIHIESYRFGNMVIDGKAYTDDLKIINGNILPDWWRKKGHEATVGDLQDALDAHPDVLIIGTGSSGGMRVGSDLVQACADQGIELIAKPTSKAVTAFNRLQGRDRAVAAGFHLTC